MKFEIKKYLTPRKYLDFFLRNVRRLSFNLEDKGERVDINLNRRRFFYEQNEKCHLNRYLFASSLMRGYETVGDIACGSGYGSVILSQKARYVIGVDVNKRVINEITRRYHKIRNLQFIEADLLNIDKENFFDCIVSFETIEHFPEVDIGKIFNIFHKALKVNGRLIFSTPYMQEKSKQAIKMGFHKTFYINEEKIKKWLGNRFLIELLMYQNYKTCKIEQDLKEKDFIIVVAKKQFNYD